MTNRVLTRAMSAVLAFTLAFSPILAAAQSVEQIPGNLGATINKLIREQPIGPSQIAFDPGTRIVTGKALPYETVTVKVNGTTAGTAVAAPDGSWTYTLGSAPASGAKITAVSTSGAVFTVSSAGDIIFAPINTAAPVISGSPPVGQTLTASQGSWSNSPTSYAYAWKAAGVALSGATTSSYIPASGDIGKTLTVEVTASNAAGSSVAPSAATSAVTAASSALSIVGNGTSPVAAGSSATTTPTITGGTAPYTLSLASGALAPGRSTAARASSAPSRRPGPIRACCARRMRSARRPISRSTSRSTR